jgi:hypothetical protein
MFLMIRPLITPRIIIMHKACSHAIFFSERVTAFVTRLTRRVSLVEKELLTLPEHLSSPRF